MTPHVSRSTRSMHIKCHRMLKFILYTKRLHGKCISLPPIRGDLPHSMYEKDTIVYFYLHDTSKHLLILMIVRVTCHWCLSPHMSN